MFRPEKKYSSRGTIPLDTAERTEKHEQLLSVGPAANDTQARFYSLNLSSIITTQILYSQLITRYTL
jgi:hypothetical protein